MAYQRRNWESRSVPARNRLPELECAFVPARNELGRLQAGRPQSCRKRVAGGSDETSSGAMDLCRSCVGFHFIYADRSAQVSAFSFGEDGRKKLPFLEIGRRKIRRRAFDDRAKRALLIDAKIRRRRRPLGHGHRLQRTVALQPDREGGFWILALDSAIRFFPAALDLLPEHRAPGSGIVCRRALGRAKRRVGIERFAGDGLARRIALVEQCRDLGLIEGAILRLWRLRRRLWGLGHRR